MRFTPPTTNYSLYLLDKNTPFHARNPQAVLDEPNALPPVWRKPQPSPHANEDHEINVVVSGTCRYVWTEAGKTKAALVSVGQVFAIPGGVSHTVEVEDKASVRGFWIHPHLFRKMALTEPGDALMARFGDLAISPKETRLSRDNGLFWTLQNLFEQTLSEYARNDHRQAQSLYLLASSVALTLLRLYEAPRSTALDHPTHERVLAVRAWIDRNYLEPVTLPELADKASLSVSQFAGLFRRLVGVSPKSYLLGLRLNQVKTLLATTELPVSQIAVSVGFTRLNHFNDLFHTHCGLSPTEYRKTSSE